MKTSWGAILKDFKPDADLEGRVVGLWGEVRKKADGEFKNFEDFLYLPFSNYLPELTLPTNLKHVVLVGIGGSSLASKAVYDAVFGHFDSVEPKRFPKLHILENVDENYVDKLMSLLAESSPDFSDLAFVVVCKSGRTFETLKNLAFMSQDKYRGMVRGDNTHVISVEGNHTWQWGEKLGAKLYPMAQAISGRFSVFSAVSAVPLGLVGVDVASFVDGAKERVGAVSEVQKYVATRYKYYQAGLTSDVYFAFDDRQKSLAEWMCSITAESLGKAEAGITPITSVGSRDLHSIGQLYLQGRRDKVTTFLSLSDTDKNNLYILDAVKRAYDDANLPYSHTVLDASSPTTLAYNLGDFMQSWIIYTVLLGGLMGLNPYDQPGVELYKKYLQ